MTFQATLDDRIRAARDSRAYRNYEVVRRRVLDMKEAEQAKGGVLGTPSAYWREELANFEYMLDASPLVIERLRHHCNHLTGVRVYDYRSNRDEPKARFEEKLWVLIERGGKELLVPESPLLGGFGFNIDGDLINIDTLKYFEALIALNLAAVLDEFRFARERRLVWEIGGGWGGFAYQFKSLCPNITYVIMDLPEVLLFAGTYLMTVFPEARVRLCDGTEGGDALKDWRDLDFVFMPNWCLDAFAPERVDLTINMVSFQEMTAEQVHAYVEKAHRLKSPYLYSLNRHRSPYNLELTSVYSLAETFYWLREIIVLPVSYTKMNPVRPGFQGPAAAVKVDSRPDRDYKHVIGTQRLLI